MNLGLQGSEVGRGRERKKGWEVGCVRRQKREGESDREKESNREPAGLLMTFSVLGSDPQ
jgi:hypothetical protein